MDWKRNRMRTRRDEDDGWKGCTECGKKFWSWKALFGHMRCHPERQWRGINPPPNLIRTQQLQHEHEHDHEHEHEHVHAQQQQQQQEEHEQDQVIMMTQEDHEVAACLLLLANATSSSDHFERWSCNKVFPSLQALGGHRASHKNVKGCLANTNANSSSDSSSHHRCNICLRVFSTGQALGGHKSHAAKVVATVLGIPFDAPQSKVIQDLRERYFGPSFALMSHDKYAEIWDIDEKDPLVGPEGGESVKDVACRLTSAMAVMESEFKGCAILVVSHGDPLQILQTIVHAANQHKEPTDVNLASTIKAVQVTPILSQHRKYALLTAELRAVI